MENKKWIIKYVAKTDTDKTKLRGESERSLSVHKQRSI